MIRGPSKTWQQIGVGLLALPWAWLGMMAVHEAGHALAAWATGGGVVRIELPVIGFSRTEVAPNPHPAIVAWAGAVGGTLIPLAAWGLARCCRSRARRVFQAFAGFCALANGSYLGLGWLDHIGDAGDLLSLGAAPLGLSLAGSAGLVIGLALWHTLGPRLGLAATTPRNRARLAKVFGLLSAGAILAAALTPG